MALIRGENSIFFALGLDNESLQKDADQAAVIISKSAKDITRLGEEASESLKASLKEALSPNWLYSESNALLDELNKVLGAGLKFEPQEFDRLSKALESAQDEVEQTVVFWDFLNRKLKETKGSSEGLKELTSGVKLLEDHLGSMGVSAAEVMKKVNKALSSQPILPKETPLVEELRAIQEDAENYLPSFIGKAIGKLKGRLSEILGKDLKLDTQGLGSLDKLLKSSKDELQRLVALSGFFKEKLSRLGKETPGLQKLSSEIQKIERNLKTSGIAVEGLYNKLKKESFSLPQTKVLPYHQMAGAELSASIKGMQAYAKGMEGVKTAHQSLQAQYRNTVQEMAALRKEGKEHEGQYERLKEKATELKSTLSGTYKEVNLASTGSEGIRSLLVSANGLVGVFGAAQGAAALFGSEGKSLEKTLIKLNALLAVLHSLQSIQTALAEKNSLAFKSLAQVKSLYALATDRAVGASARLAAVMKLLGWGLIVAGIAAAVKAFEKLSEKIQEKTAAARMSIEVQREAQKNAAQEIIHLKLLYEQAKNENNSRNLRIKALQELNQRYPEFLNFLKLENIGSRKAAEAIHGQTQAIMRRAKARAYEEKLVDLEKKKMEAKSKGDEAYLGWLDRGVLVLSEWMARGTIHMTKPLLKSYSNALEKNFEKEKQIFLNKRRGQIEKNRLQEGKRYDQEMAQLQGLLGKELSSGEVDFSSEKSSLSKQGENQSPFKSLIKASEEARDKVKEAVKDIEQAIVEGYDRISREKEQKRIEAMEMGFEKEKARLDQERQERERAIEKEKAARSEKIQSLEKEEKAAHNRIKEFREKGLESLATKEKALIKEIQSNKKQLIAQNQNLHFKATEAAREQYFEQLAKLQEKYKEGTLSQIQEQIAVLGQKALYAGREERKEIQEQIKILQEKASLEDRESSVILKNIQIHRMTIGVLNEQIDKNRELISQKERGLELDKKRYDQGRLSWESLRKTEKALEDLKEEGLKLQEGKEEKYAQLAGWIHFGSYQFSRTLGDLKEFLGLEPQLVEKINGIVEGASGASQAIAGIAAKNPMMALQGMLKTIGSLFSGEVLSETKKYEGLIGDLSEAFGVLQMKMQRAKGEEKEENFTAQIKNHQERMQQLAHASEAEKRARKTRFWGLFKGRRGGAADWNKVRAFERQREEEYEKLADTYERQREYLTATSQNTIIEKMVLALEKGKEAMKSFEESFDEMVRGTFLRKLKSEFLEKQIQAFFEQYAQATESQGSLDKQEADALRRKGQDILSAAQSRFQKMNKDLQSMGISSGFLGKTKKEGLSGQIRSVTEETAGKLEGILHNVRISQDQAIGLQQRMERHLSGIHSHTAYLKTLSSINQHLSNIDVRLVKTA